MTKRRSRRREIERLLSLRRSEGLSLRTLSERSGIPAGTLSWWSHKLRSEPASIAEPAFVELVESGSADSSLRLSASDESGSTAELRIRHPSGTILEFNGELAKAVTRSIVGGLDSWS